jgi:hypothetical protein
MSPLDKSPLEETPQTPESFALYKIDRNPEIIKGHEALQAATSGMSSVRLPKAEASTNQPVLAGSSEATPVGTVVCSSS